MTYYQPGEEHAAQSGAMTVEEAGRRGGERTAETHGRAFYQEIGRMGGQKISSDREHMASIGRRGGQQRSKKS
jgi:general stress protein YciG